MRARRWLSVSTLVASIGLAPGCTSSASPLIPESPPWYNRPASVLEILYSRNLVAESRRKDEPYEQAKVAVDPQHNRIYAGSSDHGMYALSARDGKALWRFETLAPVQSEPLYDEANNVLYFGSNDGALYKVRARDGKLLWRFATNAEIAKQPVLAGDTLYFVNANDTVVAVDAEHGALRWSQHRAPALGMEISGHAGLIVLDGRVHVAFSDGTVTAYAADTGKERWLPVDLSAEAEQSLGEVPEYLDTDTTPVAVVIAGRPAVIVGSYEGGVFALDAETGDQIWSNPGVLSVTNLSIWQQPAHQDAKGQLHPSRTHVIASTGTTGLWALDPFTGDELWQRELPNGGVSKPAFVAGAMLVSSSTHGLYLVSPLNGGVIDGFHTEVGACAPPVAYGDRAFLISNSGRLLALTVNAPRPEDPGARAPFEPSHW